MEAFQLQITDEWDNERIDKCVSEIMGEKLSRSFLQKLIKENKLLVNDRPVKVSYRVCTDDCVYFEIPDAIEPGISPEDIPLDILYEDNDLLIVNKPKGMVVHPAAGHYEHTLVNALLYHCKGNLSGINGVMRPGIIHRIDMDTSGSLVVCKNDLAHSRLSVNFQTHDITRKYIAICEGVFKELSGTVDAPIGRHPKDRTKMAIVDYKSGKRAVTHYQVLEQYSKYALVECTLETGRTHQIRVHMTSLGHPLLGDLVYGKHDYKGLGQMLHAKTLGFKHPITQDYICVDAPLPSEFQKCLENLRNGCK